jgi:hypothetical protein
VLPSPSELVIELVAVVHDIQTQLETGISAPGPVGLCAVCL